MESKNKAYQTCLSYLSRRMYFSYELKQKLMENGFEAKEAEQGVLQCTEGLLINDEDNFRFFIKDWQDVKRKGKQSLIVKLKEKGIPKDIVLEMIERYYDLEKESQVVKEWIRLKKEKQSNSIAKAESRAKIERFLYQRGFLSNSYRNELEEDR